MIRINLLPTKAGKKKAAGEGNAFAYLLFLLVVFEIGALYFWYDSKSGDVVQANAQAAGLTRKVTKLQRVKKQIADDEEKRRLLEEQNRIIERLMDGKAGPPNMLMFLSYAMTNPPDTRRNAEERKALERAHWNLGWNPDTVWLTRLHEDQHGVLEIEGEAKTHEDVAEYYERLRSCYYFYGLQPGPQEEKYNQDVELNYVAFKASMMLNYHIGPAEADEDEGAGGQGAGAGTEAGTDTIVAPGTPSVEAVPGAAGATSPAGAAGGR